MTVFENIKSKNIDELAEWLDECMVFDYNPWVTWFDENYCSKCHAETAWDSELCRDAEFAYCELHCKCRFFEDMQEAPDTRQVVRLWLESEC